MGGCGILILVGARIADAPGAPQSAQTRRRQRPVGFPGGDPPAREQDRMGPHQLMGGVDWHFKVGLAHC